MLEQRGLQHGAKAIAQKPGKEFTQSSRSGQISGNFVERPGRPSGRYAVTERAGDVSLVP